MSEIALIALDLDGTLLTRDKRMTERTKDVLCRAIAAGIAVVPVTGRPLSGLPREVAAVAGLRYAITSNGAVTTDVAAGRTLRSACLDRETAAQLVRLPIGRGLIHCAFFDGYGWCEPAFFEKQWAFFRGTAQESYVRESRRVVPDLSARIARAQEGIENIWMLAHDRQERDAIERTVQEKWAVKTIPTGAIDLEIVDLQADKGLALAALAQTLGIARERILAIGDNENDLGMLRAAGVSAAMANGTDRAKQAADFVTDDNESDGAAKAIERVCRL